MKRNRYQTYVFDSQFDTDPKSNKEHRSMLGPEYKGGVPCAWADGHSLRTESDLLDFIRDIVYDKYKTKEQIVDEAENLLERLNLG